MKTFSPIKRLFGFEVMPLEAKAQIAKITEKRTPSARDRSPSGSFHKWKRGRIIFPVGYPDVRVSLRFAGSRHGLWLGSKSPVGVGSGIAPPPHILKFALVQGLGVAIGHCGNCASIPAWM